MAVKKYAFTLLTYAAQSLAHLEWVIEDLAAAHGAGRATAKILDRLQTARTVQLARVATELEQAFRRAEETIESGYGRQIQITKRFIGSTESPIVDPRHDVRDWLLSSAYWVRLISAVFRSFGGSTDVSTISALMRANRSFEKLVQGLQVTANRIAEGALASDSGEYPAGITGRRLGKKPRRRR